MDELADLRRQIDEVDDSILALLNRRADLAKGIAEVKRGLKSDLHIPVREKEIYERLLRQNTGPFPSDGVRSVFREIISASLSLEGPLKVAYLGPRATFTHLACTQYFGFSVRDIPVNSIKEVFEEVERGRSDYGVVPVENSTEGVVSHTLDLFADSELKIFGEILQEVSHHLQSKSGKVEEVRKIYSHPHAIAQCKSWLEKNLPQAQVREVSSTARAAEMAAEDPEAAAIASELAARLYGLVIIRRRIEDNINNFTRFLIIAQRSPARTGKDKTSIMFSTKDRVGALFEMLRPFSDSRLILTKIESRPSKKKAWEYLFYVDLLGHVEDEPVRRTLETLKEQALFMKILGSYPTAN